MTANATPHENLTNSRYTDLLGEPVARLLSPIKGYEAAPLVSLEQAITYISHLFDGIEENVWVAKENSKNPPDNLNQDESAAIHLYTMQFDTDPSFYQLLNSTLRGENRDNLKPWFAYLKLFLTALYKLPSHPQTIWRGVRGVDLSKQYQTGSKFAWWGVSSCTTSLEVLQAETFLGKHGMRTLFSIESQNGKIIVPHSYFKDTEKEIVLMPGTYFEVVGQLNPAEDLYIIQLRELDPPFALVKPPFKREPSVQKASKPPDNSTPPTTNPSSETMSAVQNRFDTPKFSNMMNPQFHAPMNNFWPGSGNSGLGPDTFRMDFGHSNLSFPATLTNPLGGFPTVFAASTNEGSSSSTPGTAPQSSSSKLPKARIVHSTMSPQMQEAVIDLIREAIAEGTDDDDIKTIIVDELIRKYGGVWWANITPKTESHGSIQRKVFLSIKIDKYAISVIQQ